MSYDILREQHRMRDRMPLVPKSSYTQQQPTQSPLNVPFEQEQQFPPPIPEENRLPQNKPKTRNKYGDEGFE